MGLFDSVYVACKCGASIEFQSKAGECYMHSYSLEEVPVAIADDLNGQTRSCVQCSTAYTLTTTIPSVVAMTQTVSDLPKCPECQGYGRVDANEFFLGFKGLNKKMCQTCWGKGVVPTNNHDTPDGF